MARKINRSEVQTDPYIKLATSVLIQAIKDLRSKNPTMCQDAFLWLLDPGIKWGRFLNTPPTCETEVIKMALDMNDTELRALERLTRAQLPGLLKTWIEQARTEVAND